MELTVNPGDLYLVAAMACYALYATLLRKRPPIHPMSFLVITIGLGGLMLMPATAMEMASGFVMQADGQTLLTLAYVVLIATILAYICFNRGVELIGPNRAGPFFHLDPCRRLAGGDRVPGRGLPPLPCHRLRADSLRDFSGAGGSAVRASATGTIVIPAKAGIQ